mmetsp:Transcript_29320/g.98151  ORF Transcript_29320/g.98151 Transcript_29320/m.98151 type:complete len:220 (+) Transcript_29320:222-881(+)
MLPSSTRTPDASRPRLSSRRGRRAGGSVAVRSSHGTPGRSARREPRRAYSGRKSDPHDTTQCASSTTTRCSSPRDASERSTLPSDSDCSSRSGVTKRSFAPSEGKGAPPRRPAEATAAAAAASSAPCVLSGGGSGHARSSCKTAVCSAAGCEEQRWRARTRSESSASRWSRISASSGTTTTVIPGVASEASWNVRLLPPPVGMRRRTSRPLSEHSIAWR